MQDPENKPVIAVDIDEVITPHFQDLIDWYNHEYGTHLTLEHNHPKDPRPWGTDSIAEAIKRVHIFFDTPAFINAEPYKEAIEALKELSKKFKLVVVTARDSIVEKVTRDWLDTHFKELFHDAHFSARYSLEQGKSRTKADICVSIGAEYLIDDSLDNIIGAAEVGVKSLLYGDYPWNQLEHLPKNVTRVKDWQEVLEYFSDKGR